VQWNREIHTGTMFGLPSRIAASVFSLLLSVLAVSGSMIWVNRKLAAARGRRMAATRGGADDRFASSACARHQHRPPMDIRVSS
jgi:uncharacterized iron-regulated membrane protein